MYSNSSHSVMITMVFINNGIYISMLSLVCCMLPRRNTISDLDLGLYFIPRSYEYEIFGIPNISFFIFFGISDYYLLLLLITHNI